MRPVLALLVMALAGPAAAQSSRAAEWFVGQEIAGSCDGRGDRITRAGLFERDSNGDGRTGLIIAHEGIKCAGSPRSLNCGAQVCEVVVLMREGDLLVERDRFLGSGVSVGPGPVFMVSGFAHGGGR